MPCNWKATFASWRSNEAYRLSGERSVWRRRRLGLATIWTRRPCGPVKWRCSDDARAESDAEPVGVVAPVAEQGFGPGQGIDHESGAPFDRLGTGL